MHDLSGFRVAIVVTDGFEESEFMEPMRALEKAGATITVVGPEKGRVQGVRHMDKGEAAEVERVLADIDAEDFDGVVLPGGTVNSDALRMNEDLHDLLRDFQKEGKPIAAICHAQWALISAGIVEGRLLTSYVSIQDDIRNAGGRWVDREVVVDGNFLTSRQPDDLPAFNKAMLDLFSTAQKNAMSGKSLFGGRPLQLRH